MHDYRKFLLTYARESLKENNFYQTDLALQVYQSRFPDDPISYNLHALLAYRLGLYSQAARFVNKALTLDPSFAKALENKAIIDKALKSTLQTKSNQQHFLLIHSWGSGLGFDLLFLLKQLMLAELTEREPVIYWGHNSLYNAHPETDCFTDYFEPVSSTTIDEITPLAKTAYPNFWQNRPLDDYARCTKLRNKDNNKIQLVNGLYYLNRDESLVVSGEFTSVKMLKPWIEPDSRFYGMSEPEVYRDLMAKYIKPKPFLIDRAQSFIDKTFKDKEFIAIHLRGTDKAQEKQSQDIASINEELIKQATTLDKSLSIFVMTDDVRQIRAMQKRFGKRIHSVEVTRSDGNDQGVHHTANNKQKIAEEVLVDVLIAAQSKHFFGCGFSYLACCVAYTRENDATSTLLPFDVMTRFNNIPQQIKKH